MTQSWRSHACDSTQTVSQTHRKQAPSSSQTSGKSHLFCLRHLADSCSHQNIRRRRDVDMRFVAVVTANDRESWIQFNFYDLTPTMLQSWRCICVASATYVHICRKASATISQARRRHDCVICEPSFGLLSSLVHICRRHACDVPATCLRQGRRCYRRYPPEYVNVCRRHAADISGCPGPCRRQTGNVDWVQLSRSVGDAFAVSETLAVVFFNVNACRRLTQTSLRQDWHLIALYSIWFKVTDGSNLRPITALFLFFIRIFFMNIEAEICEVLSIF